MAQTCTHTAWQHGPSVGCTCRSACHPVPFTDCALQPVSGVPGSSTHGNQVLSDRLRGQPRDRSPALGWHRGLGQRGRGAAGLIAHAFTGRRPRRRPHLPLQPRPAREGTCLCYPNARRGAVTLTCAPAPARLVSAGPPPALRSCLIFPRPWRCVTAVSLPWPRSWRAVATTRWW